MSSSTSVDCLVSAVVPHSSIGTLYRCTCCPSGAGMFGTVKARTYRPNGGPEVESQANGRTAQPGVGNW